MLMRIISIVSCIGVFASAISVEDLVANTVKSITKSSAHFAAVSSPGKNGKLQLRALNTPSTNVDSSPMIVIVYEYFNTDCSGDFGVAVGFTLNQCFATFDSSGKQSGSCRNQFIGKQPNSLILSDYTEFATADCSSTTAFEQSKAYPSKCTVSGDGKLSLRTVYTNETDPTKQLKEGLLFAYYDVTEACQSNSLVSSYSWVKLNTCIPNDVGGSTLFTACDSGKFSANVYSDPKCTVLQGSVQAPLEACTQYTGGDVSETGKRYTNFVAQKCV